MSLEEGDLQGVLARMRRESTSQTDKGKRFERLCQAALTAHYGADGTQRFRRVWLWSEEWPGKKTPTALTSADLVAEQIDGSLAAIQCKCRHEQKVSTQEVNSFLAASSRPEFSARVIMTTGSGFNRHGQNKLTNAHPPCEVFDMSRTSSWEVNWGELAERTQAITGETPPRPPRTTRFDTDLGLGLLGLAAAAVVIATVAALVVVAVAPATWSVSVVAFLAALVTSVAALAFAVWISRYS